MEVREKGILAAGLVVAATLFLFVDRYLAGIAVVLVLALAMAFQIMGETRHLPPRLAGWLTEDAKRIVLVNRGNDRAVGIHVTLVPLNREFDLSELAAEARYEFPLPAMVDEAKAVVTWEDPSGRKFSGSFRLSATGKNEEELLKPFFPTFGWK